MIRIVLLCCLCLSALPVPAFGQTSLLQTRKVIRQGLIEVQRGLSRCGETSRDSISWQRTIANQVKLGDLDGAVKSVQRALNTGNTGLAEHALGDLGDYIEDWESFDVLLQRPESKALPNYEALSDYCNCQLLLVLTAREGISSRNVERLLSRLPRPEACISPDGEISRYYVFEAWTTWYLDLIKSGEISKAVTEIESLPEGPPRTRISEGVINGVINLEPDVLKLLIAGWNDPQSRIRLQETLINILTAREQHADAARVMLEIERIPEETHWLGMYLETAFQLILVDDQALADQILERVADFVRSQEQKVEQKLAEIRLQVVEASCLSLKGETVNSFERIAEARDSYLVFDRTEENGALFDGVSEEICRFLRQGIQLALHRGDVESASAMLDLFEETDFEREAAILYFQQMLNLDNSMYLDEAMERVISTLWRTEPANARSSAAYDLIANSTIELDEQQIEALYEIGKTGYYRFEIIAEVVNRKVAEGMDASELGRWEQETRNQTIEEGDSPETAWYAIISANCRLGRFEHALELVGTAGVFEDPSSVLLAVMFSSGESGDGAISVNETANKLVEILESTPNINLDSILGEATRLPQELAQRLARVAVEQPGRIQTDNCYALALAAQHLDMDIFALERLFSRALSAEYSEYALDGVRHALAETPAPAIREIASRLKIPWLFAMCRTVELERLALTDYAAAVREVIEEGDPEIKNTRANLLWQAWESGAALRPESFPEGLRLIVD
jgi:hypothetical protein